MNIKILKELSKQAETECGWSEEKFAELIIQEFIFSGIHSIARNHPDGRVVTLSFKTSEDAAGFEQHAIASTHKHFGL